MGFVIFKDFIYLFLERGERKEKEKERKTNVWLPLMRPLLEIWPATQACALTEWSQLPFGLQACAQSTELYQPGSQCEMNILSAMRDMQMVKEFTVQLLILVTEFVSEIRWNIFSSLYNFQNFIDSHSCIKRQLLFKTTETTFIE